MTARQTIISTILIFLLAFELLVLLMLALFPYFVDPGFVSINNGVYTFLVPLSTILMLGALYDWLVREGAREAQHRSPMFKRFLRLLSGPFQKMVGLVKTASLSNTVDGVRILPRPSLVLIVSMVVSVLLTFTPNRPDLNPTGSLVGVDSQLYVDWIRQMLARPFPQAIQYSFVQGLEGSRPLLLIPLYLVAVAGISPSTIVEYLPMLLAPLLSLSTYIFVRYGQGSAALAGLASLFTAVSFYTTVGLWGGYYANWLSLSFSFLFMTTLLTFSKRPSAVTYVMMFVLSLALFLTHPWTWVLVLTVSLVFALTVWRETRNRTHLESILGLIATGIVLDIIKHALFATPTVASDIATKSPSSLGSLLGFWNNLVQALLYTNNGLMADWLILGLAMLATFMLRFKRPFERLLLLWAAVPSVPFLVLDSYNQSRIIYDLPTPVLAAAALALVVSQIRDRHWPGIIIVLTTLTIANYALQSILQL